MRTSPLFSLCLLSACFTHYTTESATSPAPQASALSALQAYLDAPPATRGALSAQGFASVALTMEEAAQASALLYKDLLSQKKAEREAEFSARVLGLGALKMPFWFKTFGDAPATGHSLYISMHGGGGAPTEVNDSQWDNQKTLYQPKEGIYLCPRAPTDTWNLWHQDHIDTLFARLIEDMLLFEGVNPNRVYLMGYSAGGDGVYQLAPRMADQFAAASMMAGHPNDASPLGLRNLPFAIHVGALDASYDRNKVAAEWGKRLDDLQAKDAAGYTHLTEIHQGRGHWMNLEDASAVEWMAQYTRDPWPARVAWHQSGVTHQRFYWLSVEAPVAGDDVIAQVRGQVIEIESSSAKRLTLLLSDELLSLSEPVIVRYQNQELFRGEVPRTASSIAASLGARLDLAAAYTATLDLTLP